MKRVGGADVKIFVALREIMWEIVEEDRVMMVIDGEGDF